MVRGGGWVGEDDVGAGVGLVERPEADRVGGREYHRNQDRDDEAAFAFAPLPPRDHLPPGVGITPGFGGERRESVAQALLGVAPLRGPSGFPIIFLRLASPALPRARPTALRRYLISFARRCCHPDCEAGIA